MGLVIINVGHSAADQGARSVDGTGEYTYGLSLAPLIRDALKRRDVACEIVLRTHGISQLVRDINALDGVASVALHFNAFSDPSANGAEVVYAEGSARGRALARALQAAQVEALGVRHRRLKAVTRTDRGGRELFGVVPPAVIVEPGFGTNADDWHAMTTRKHALAEAYADAIVGWLG